MNLGLTYNLTGGDNGTVTTITNNVDNGRTQTLGYDPLNRISSATSQATSGTDCWGQNFGPDPLANLNSISVSQCSAGSLSVTVDGNNHINVASYVYDAAGNLTQDGTGYTYTFDAENRLTLASGMTGGPYCYVYDGNGLRVAKKSSASSCSSGTVSMLYWRLLSGDSLAETDGSGDTLNEYVFFAGRRVASRNGSGAIFYYFADQVGSTRSITTGSGPGQTPGQLCYDADFTPYGQEMSHSERLQTTSCPPNYKFTGYERDPETGLDYAFARYYSSRLGRFLSADRLRGAVGSLQSHNAYAYVANNPTNLTDPSGLCGRNPNNAMVVTPCADPDCPSVACGGGGGGLDGGCELNGAPAACSMVYSLVSNPSGATVPCPSNVCSYSQYTSYSNSSGQTVIGFWQQMEFSANLGDFYATSGPGALYYNADQAGGGAGAYFLPYAQADHREFGGAIKQNGDFFSYTLNGVGPVCQPNEDCQDTVWVGGEGDVAAWHTHVYEQNIVQFLGDRMATIPYPDYVTTPMGSGFGTFWIAPWAGNGQILGTAPAQIEMLDYPQIAPICQLPGGASFPGISRCP